MIPLFNVPRNTTKVTQYHFPLSQLLLPLPRLVGWVNNFTELPTSRILDSPSASPGYRPAQTKLEPMPRPDARPDVLPSFTGRFATVP